jgi:hypothetical protein
MKKLFLLLVLFASVLMAQSQVYVKNDVDEVIDLNIKEDLNLIRLIGVSLSESYKEVPEIIDVVQELTFLTNVRLYIDYGQKINLKEKDSYIVDSDGNEIEFQSIIAAMNYIERNGWEYLNDASTLASTGDGLMSLVAVYYYTFRKK